MSAGPEAAALASAPDAVIARLEALDTGPLLRIAIGELFKDRIAVVSSFGAESAVLLDLVAAVDPATPVIFLDTGQHFAATLEYRRRLSEHLGLKDVRVIRPEAAALERLDPQARLWRTDPDRCCRVRKVLPVRRALEPFAAWISGIKRYHEAARKSAPRVAVESGRFKLNPLADWSEKQVKAALEARGLPRHPLVSQGFASIGCEPCTRPVRGGEPHRAGRWAGLEKTECGLHLPEPAVS